MRRPILLCLAVGLAGLAASAQGQVTIFECPFQGSSPFECRWTAGGGGSLALVLTRGGAAEGACGEANHRWEFSHSPNGGWNDRGYVRQTFCTAAEHRGAGEFPAGWTFSSPPALDPLWPGVDEFFGRIRLYFEGPIEATDSGAIRALKWLMAHAGVFDGDQRMIFFFERGDIAGTHPDRTISLSTARNIFSGRALDPKSGLDMTRASVGLKQWLHLQYSWKHGPSGVSCLKLWVNSNDYHKPTSTDCALTTVPREPGGTSEWVRDNAAYQGDWTIGGASSTGTQFNTRLSVRFMDWQVGAAFDPSWAPADRASRGQRK